MLFTEFGNIENPPVLLLHGMMQDWHARVWTRRVLNEAPEGSLRKDTQDI